MGDYDQIPDFTEEVGNLTDRKFWDTSPVLLGRLYILLDKYFNKRPKFVLPAWNSHQFFSRPWFHLKADRFFC